MRELTLVLSLFANTKQVAVEKTVIFLQAVTRGWLARRLCKRMKKLLPILVAAMKKRELPAIEAVSRLPMRFRHRLPTYAMSDWL